MSVMNAAMALELLRDRILSAAHGMQNYTKRIARASRYLKFNKREAGWRTTISIQVFRNMEADVNEERASWEMMRLEQGLQN